MGVAGNTSARVTSRGWTAQALILLLLPSLWALLTLVQGSRAVRAGTLEPITVWGVVTAETQLDHRSPVSVVLYSEHGAEARPRARIEAQSGTRFSFTGLGPGIHHIAASSGDLFASATFTITGRGKAGPFVLALERGHVLAGRITGTGGSTLEADVVIRHEPVQGDPTSQSAWFPPVAVRTGPDGRFAIPGLPATTCRVEIAAQEHASAVRPRTEVPGANVEVRLIGLAVWRIKVAKHGIDDDLVALPGAEVRVFSPGVGIAREALTGPEGTVVFDGLLPGDYFVDGRMAQMLTYKPLHKRILEGEDTELVLVVKPGLAIEGVVRDSATSLPVEGACIVVSSRTENPSLACSSSDVKGRFRVPALAPGSYALVIQAAGYLRERLPPVKIGWGGTQPLVDVLMDRSLRIAGTVTDSSGRPVEGARIFADEQKKLSTSLLEGFLDLNLPLLVPKDPGVLAIGELGVTLGPVPPIPIEPLEPRAGPGQAEPLPAGCACLEEQPGSMGSAGLSGPDGTFVLEEIAPGEISLLVVHPGFATLRSEPLALTAAQAPEPVLLVLDPGGTLGGSVLDGDGVPVTGALVWIEGSSTFLAQPIVVGPAGTWRADHVVGEVKVNATCPGYFAASRTVTLASGTSSLNIDLVLEPEGERVQARVLDPWAFPVQEALVMVTTGSGKDAITRSVRSDTDGVISFPALPGPVWVIVASHPSWRTLRTVLDPWEPWDEPVLSMGFAAGVSGTVRDGWSHLPMEKFTVTVLRDGDPVARRTFFGGGFTFMDLPPGDCILRFEAPIYETLAKEVSLPRGSGPTDVTLPDLELWMDPVDPGA